MDCYRCDDEISNENVSDEHIILNACGGRLKSKNLLCEACNSIFGSKFDHELAKSTNDIANLLMIKRQDGVPQPIDTVRTSTKDKYYLQYGGSPVQAKTHYEIIPEDEIKAKLNVEAKNRKELKKTLIGLKRKHPGIDVEKILDEAEEKSFYYNDSFEVKSHIGGDGAFKSIAKTAINFFIYKGGDSQYIKHLLPYLEGIEKQDIVWMHYPNKDIYKPDKDEVSHVLKIVGDSTEKILYAYVELFNLHCFIVRLNDSYNGEDIDSDYICNVHTYHVKENKTDLKVARNELVNLFSNKDAKPFEKVKNRYARVLTIANKIQDKHQLHEIISNAVDNTMGLLPEGTVIDENIAHSMFDELMKNMMPFIAHRNNLKNIE
jgi:hypothetical protein